MIVVQDICKRFGEVEAVKQVSFRAEDSRVTALLGPNGAGKSTTLRVLSAVVRADSGSAEINGHQVSTSPNEVRASIGVLPHNSGIYSRLTARENVAYYGKLQGLSGDTLQQRIEALIQQLDMAAFADRRCEGFSQGQKIKVALARALVHDPKHVLLDEPTNGLDVMATRALREIILDLKARGCCVLFSSHIMQEVENLCDDIVIIAGGTVRFQGTLAALRDTAQESNLEDAFIRIAEVEAEGLV